MKGQDLVYLLGWGWGPFIKEYYNDQMWGKERGKGEAKVRKWVLGNVWFGFYWDS